MVEIVGKLVVTAHRFSADRWNVLNLAIVIFWCFGRVEAVNSNLTIPCMARFVRLLRLLHLIQNNLFEPLYCITKAISLSVVILGLALCLILLHLCVVDMIMCSILRGFIQDSSQRLEVHEAVFKSWGTYYV